MSMIYALNLEIITLTALINITPINESRALRIRLNDLENELMRLIHQQNNGGGYRKRLVRKRKPNKKYY